MSFRGHPEGRSSEDEVRRLIEENRDLKAQLHAQSRIFADLEGRLLRVENSVVFRFLRWLGPRLARMGVPWFQHLRRAAAREYAESARQVTLLRRTLSTLRAKVTSSGHETTVSILILGRDSHRAAFDRLLTSIAEQEHRDWELFVASDGAPPGWLSESVSKHGADHRTEIFTIEHLQRGALSNCMGDFVAVLGANTVLEPDALHQLLQCARDDAGAVYSDWDYVDKAGQFHSPQFTPELSLELLRRTRYWGECYLVRTDLLRRLDWQGDLDAQSLIQDLPLRLANAGQPFRRVPQVLWHAQNDAGEQTRLRTQPLIAGCGSVSVIVCSRNPAHLSQCLDSVLPTLDRRHELIVVAHGSGGKGPLLEQTAANRNVRSVRYDGPFHFGLMNHLGIAQARGEILCLLNDDVEPVSPDWLERMQAQAERPEMGVVGALLLYPDRTIQHAGVVVGDGCLPTHLGHGLKDSPYWPWLRITREVTAVTAACLALRREVWDQLGGFDLRFPSSYNDVDLCLRARERGYQILLEADAVLIHHESRSRNPLVLSEEASLFRALWSHVVLGPERFFNPELELTGGDIRLRRSPASVAHRAGLDAQALRASREAAGVLKIGANK